MLQTNNTVVCMQCLSPTGPALLAVHKPLRFYVALLGTV